MSIIGIIKIALKSLARNKTRTFLTMLGVIIGVAAVITMLAIGEGAKKIVEDQINSMGTNVIMVSSNFMSQQSNVRQAQGGGNIMDEDDVAAVKESIDGVLYASPIFNTWGRLKYENQNWRGGIMGVDVDYFSIRNMTAEQGELFYPPMWKTAARSA